MFSANDLTAEQKETIHAWVAEGAQMADVQKRLNEAFQINVTYMDTRFLALDLDLQFQSEEENVPEPPAEEVSADQEDPEAGMSGNPEPDSGSDTEGGFMPVTVGLDQVARPGAMVSGTVSFSDGEKGRWMIDEMGRPSIDPDTPGYQPPKDDLIDFQNRLRDLLEGPA